MADYEKANSDSRDTLERYLPAIYRRSTDGSEEHNAFLGALKGMLVTAESDLVENVKQIYLSKASGAFLDLYGKWVGITRKSSELDDSYRDRIEQYILTERATILGIITGIRRELNDDSIPVDIYEPWRNIFILNRSLLNGPDRIMGNFYRYAVIQVTIGKYIDKATLDKIIMKYKAYGIYVYYVYSSQMTGDYLSLPISISKSGSTTTEVTQAYKYDSIGINDLPNGSLVDKLFILNKSNLNGDDVIAGSPENTFAYQYGSVPSKNIFGVIPVDANPSSYTDPYDYVYQNTPKEAYIKPDNINFNLLSGTYDSTYTATPYGTGTLSKYTNLDGSTGNRITASKGSGSLIGYYIPYISLGNTKDVTYSLKVKNANSISGINLDGIKLNSNGTNSEDGYVYYTGTGKVKSSTNSALFLYFDATNSDIDVVISNIKIEYGTTNTGWYPSSTDAYYNTLLSSKVYPYNNTSYVNMGRKDGITESFNKSADRLVTALNVKEYMTKIPDVPGRNYVLNSSGINATGSMRPTLIGNISLVNDDASVSYTTESIVIKNKASSSQYGWFYQISSNGIIPTDSPIIPGQSYTLSAKVRGTVSQVALRWGSTLGVVNSGINFYNISNKWTTISATFSISKGAQDIFLRIQGAVNNQYLTGFTGNETFEFKEVKVEQGSQATDWTPAPEDSTTGITAIGKFNQSNTTGIILDIYDSPYGTSNTSIVARKSSDNTVVTGSWYKYDNGSIGSLIGSSIPKSDTSTGSYIYLLSTPSNVGSIEFSDYYQGDGASRVISIYDGKYTAKILSTDSQGTGTVSVPTISDLGQQIMQTYLKEVYNTSVSTSTNYVVYNYATSKWDAVLPTTNLSKYIQQGSITGGSYILLGIELTGNTSVDYIGIDVKSYT